MNHALHLFLLITSFSIQGFAQQKGDSTIRQSEIIGIWQLNSSVVSSALKSNFQFYKTGKFVYNIDEYNDLNPIRSISGKFKMEGSTLYLKIEEIRKLAEYKVVESSPAFQFGPFVLDGGKIITVKQSDSTYSEHEIKIVKNQKTKCVTIDFDKYFKLSSDPDKSNK